jgi:uncharacterized protein YndB with AHSA1/START domain
VEQRVSIEIDAPVETVWATMTDVERWPEWSGSIQHVEFLGGGTGLAVGFRARIKSPRLPAMVWEVTELQRERSFTWQATRGGMTSVSEHRLSVSPGGRVTADLGLRGTGVLAPLAGLLTSGLLRRYLRMEAEGLKRQCESARKPAR